MFTNFVHFHHFSDVLYYFKILHLCHLTNHHNVVGTTRFSCDDYYDFKRGLKQEQCLKQLFETFEDAAPSRATVIRTFGRYCIPTSSG